MQETITKPVEIGQQQAIPSEALLGDTSTYQRLTENVISRGDPNQFELLKQGLGNRIKEGSLAALPLEAKDDVAQLREMAIRADLTKNANMMAHIEEVRANKK